MKKRRLPSPVLSACRNVIEQMPREFFNKYSWNIQEIKAVQVHHTRMANGLIFGIGRKRVVFSGDTKPCDLLVQEGMNADLLIHEATFEDGHEDDALRKKKHSTMGQTVEIGRKMEVRHVILTHFSARYLKVPELPAYLKECGNVGVAVDNLRLRFDHFELVQALIVTTDSETLKSYHFSALYNSRQEAKLSLFMTKCKLSTVDWYREVYQEELFEIELRKDLRALRQKEDLELKHNMETKDCSNALSYIFLFFIYNVTGSCRVLIPADATPENVTTSIVDCSVGNEDDAYISSVLKWLLLLREVYGTDHEMFVILVGNKSDGPSNHTEKKAVVHPTRPLYNADEKRLTDKAQKELIRVFKVPVGCSTELSPEGIQFLSALLEKRDEDKDQCLSPCEIANLALFLIFFNFLDKYFTVIIMITKYIGEDGVDCGFYLLLRRIIDDGLHILAICHTGIRVLINESSKLFLSSFHTELLTLVFLCNPLVGRGLLDSVHSGRRHPYVINRVKVKEDSKYLVLREVDVLSLQDVLSSAETTADVVSFVYDISNPHSFPFCATIYQKYFCRTRTPFVIIATKVGREEVEQWWEVSPEKFGKQYELPRPIQFTDDQIGFAGGPIFE
ncbi:hypothetical protein DICVIV_13501 [Dictyocaulus viviparus]|uniref:ribonuclease Z n=1 Tax=Dictyocaulus viviparus TaxID=29172 RepID=A0A0D8XA79_DICVI|nr:hypothetical protein DICVIV_13501 [Dictyocaulus viviparus]